MEVSNSKQEMCKKYFIQLAYNGSQYHGWQIQPNANSVQAEVNNALSVLLQESINVVGAGRTDTGVHAKQMFAHFETQQDIKEEDLMFKLNQFLPKDISCQKVFAVAPDVHARFSATQRTYHYHIALKKNVFTAQTSFFYNKNLDVKKMNEAAKYLVQHADFSCFSKIKTDTNNNFCTITEAYWQEQEEAIVFIISANRFLRNMVRAIVGTMLMVGESKILPKEMLSIIASKKREKAGKSVAPQGLFLTKIVYPDFE